jgi:hypothetical protein
VNRQPNHYHLQAVTGLIVEHFHTTPGRAHEHDGLRRYATTRKSIEKRREEYRAERQAAHEARVNK